MVHQDGERTALGQRKLQGHGAVIDAQRMPFKGADGSVEMSWWSFFGVEKITGSKTMPNVPSALFAKPGKKGGTEILAIPLSEIKRLRKWIE